MSNIARELADALRGLLSQAAVDGADEEEIDLEVVDRARAALDDYDIAGGVEIGGVPLRDYFAAHAPRPIEAMDLNDHSAYRYRYADAMLVARDAK